MLAEFSAVTLSLSLSVTPEVDTVSHTTAPSGGHSNWESHSSQPRHPQPLTRSRPRSDGTPTTVGGIHGSPPTQQPPPQAQASVTICHHKLSQDAVRAMFLYDRGKLQTVKGTKGVSSLIIGRYIQNAISLMRS